MKNVVILFLLLAASAAHVSAQSDSADHEPRAGIEVYPSFLGGELEFHKYLAKELRYPQECKRLGIIGRVWVEYVVGTDGAISDVKVVRGVHADLDAEAVRLISTMPRWTPGEVGGKQVSSRMTIPVVFKIK